MTDLLFVVIPLLDLELLVVVCCELIRACLWEGSLEYEEFLEEIVLELP